MIPEAAVEAAAQKLAALNSDAGDQLTDKEWARELIEAAAPHMATQQAVAAVLRLHRALPCTDEGGDPVGGFYCEECKDLDDHSGERVHEVYPCLTVREIQSALSGDETFTAMRDKIEAQAAPNAVEHHWLLFEDDLRWGCQGCDWTGDKVEDFWNAHETRRTGDNIPF